MQYSVSIDGTNIRVASSSCDAKSAARQIVDRYPEVNSARVQVTSTSTNDWHAFNLTRTRQLRPLASYS